MDRRAGDDGAVRREPSRQVDYLSHAWREEDVCSSWRYISAKAKQYENGRRLENAAWRSWARIRFDLGSFPAEALNWQKDIDVTWLYGPLQVQGDDVDDRSVTASPAPSSPATSNSSSLLDKKPILKKRTISQSILQRSHSIHTFLSLSNVWIRAEADPDGRYVSDYPHDAESSMGMCSDSAVSSMLLRDSNPSLSDKRHISFSNEVAQCVAVEGDYEPFDDDFYGYYQPSTDGSVLDDDDDEASDDGVMMMSYHSGKPPLSSRSTPRSSFSSDSRIIAHLPSTTLKYRSDTPEPKQDADTPRPVRPSLSRSSSSETLRPSHQPAARTPSHSDFFLDEEIEVDDDWNTGWDADWNVQEESAQPTASASTPSLSSQWLFSSSKDETSTPQSTNEQGRFFFSSGVFMPFGYGDNNNTSDEEGEWAGGTDENSRRGVIDRVIDTVNTARDIAHVIWNVGWRG